VEFGRRLRRHDHQPVDEQSLRPIAPCVWCRARKVLAASSLLINTEDLQSTAL
jgi:hypothetical protein